LVQIRTRMCISLDGYVTTPDGWPVQVADPAWSPEAFGFVDFQQSLDGVLMGRTTFEPALGADRWPWPDLDVFVLGSHRPEGTPDHVVVDSDPERLLQEVRERNTGGDVHLVGGPRTIETYRRLGALDKLGLILVPLLVGDGLQLTPSVSADTALKLEEQRTLPTGVVELVYVFT
jgi:dihydrofolate reductase